MEGGVFRWRAKQAISLTVPHRTQVTSLHVLAAAHCPSTVSVFVYLASPAELESVVRGRMT